jgi:hypothetical protein
MCKFEFEKQQQTFKTKDKFIYKETENMEVLF